MLQSRNPERSICAPRHTVREYRVSDAYEVEKDTLPATPLLQAERLPVSLATRLWENRETDGYGPEENAVLAVSLLFNELSPLASAPLLENRAGEQGESAPVVESETQSEPAAPVQVKFRQAQIEVDDPVAFWEGIVGGQIAAVEEQQPLSGARIFALFEDAVRDLEFSETWLAGYLLGLSDALLRQRKTYPHTYSTLLKPLK